MEGFAQRAVLAWCLGLVAAVAGQPTTALRSGFQGELGQHAAVEPWLGGRDPGAVHGTGGAEGAYIGQEGRCALEAPPCGKGAPSQAMGEVQGRPEAQLPEATPALWRRCGAAGCGNATSCRGRQGSGGAHEAYRAPRSRKCACPCCRGWVVRHGMGTNDVGGGGGHGALCLSAGRSPGSSKCWAICAGRSRARPPGRDFWASGCRTPALFWSPAQCSPGRYGCLAGTPSPAGLPTEPCLWTPIRGRRRLPRHQGRMLLWRQSVEHRRFIQDSVLLELPVSLQMWRRPGQGSSPRRVLPLRWLIRVVLGCRSPTSWMRRDQFWSPLEGPVLLLHQACQRRDHQKQNWPLPRRELLP